MGDRAKGTVRETGHSGLCGRPVTGDSAGDQGLGGGGPVPRTVGGVDEDKAADDANGEAHDQAAAHVSRVPH